MSYLALLIQQLGVSEQEYEDLYMNIIKVNIILKII